MITCIQKYRKTMYYNKKKIVMSVAALLFFASSVAETAVVIDARSARGTWKKEVIAHRNVALTREKMNSAEITIDVPREGKYQLCAYVYHDLFRYYSSFNVEVIDSQGVRYGGEHRIEHLWYLEKRKTGRWFFVSFTNDAYWHMPKGEARLRFWVDCYPSVWEEKKEAVEGNCAIESFFLLPVHESKGALSLSWMREAEIENTAWKKYDYHSVYGTNVIETKKKNADVVYQIKLPQASEYECVLSVLSSTQNTLEITFVKDGQKKKSHMDIEGNVRWQTIKGGAYHLEAGEYTVTIRTRKRGKMTIDYFFLMPA